MEKRPEVKTGSRHTLSTLAPSLGKKRHLCHRFEFCIDTLRVTHIMLLFTNSTELTEKMDELGVPSGLLYCNQHVDGEMSIPSDGTLHYILSFTVDQYIIIRGVVVCSQTRSFSWFDFHLNYIIQFNSIQFNSFQHFFSQIFVAVPANSKMAITPKC